MLKRVFPTVVLLMVSILLPAGCTVENSNDIKASLGQEFILPVGQTATINGEGIAIKFESVNGDSRCPTGVQCIWTGEAKCQMSITHGGSTYKVTHTSSGSAEASAQDFFNGYKVSFKLLPYPEAGKQIASTDYRLRMTITK